MAAEDDRQLLVPVARRFSHEQDEGRPEALALEGSHVAGNNVDQLDIGVELGVEPLFKPGQFLIDQTYAGIHEKGICRN